MSLISLCFPRSPSKKTPPTPPQKSPHHFLLSAQHFVSSLESPRAKQVNGLPCDCRCQDWSARHTDEIKDLEINRNARMKKGVINEELNGKLNRQLCNYRRWVLINNLGGPPRAALHHTITCDRDSAYPCVWRARAFCVYVCVCLHVRGSAPWSSVFITSREVVTFWPPQIYRYTTWREFILN